MKQKYFAASNSKNGFVSYYADAFGKAERVYIIKGGPGTGKSYFMKQVAKAAELAGHETVYIYCSSDPDSLDGIIIDGRSALLDGTAPHAVEASLPGARDELIDLGRFWDKNILVASREKIEALAAEKSRSYRRAYSCLRAAGSLLDAACELILPCVLEEKLKRSASRYVNMLADGDEFKISELAVDSIGMRGERRFPTLEERARISFFIKDSFCTAHLFLSAVLK